VIFTGKEQNRPGHNPYKISPEQNPPIYGEDFVRGMLFGEIMFRDYALDFVDYRYSMLIFGSLFVNCL